MADERKDPVTGKPLDPPVRRLPPDKPNLLAAVEELVPIIVPFILEVVKLAMSRNLGEEPVNFPTEQEALALLQPKANDVRMRAEERIRNLPPPAPPPVPGV